MPAFAELGQQALGGDADAQPVGHEAQVGNARVQRPALFGHRLQPGLAVWRLQQRAGAVAIQTLELLRHAHVQVHDETALAQHAAVLRVEHDAAAGGDELAFAGAQLGDERTLAGAKAGFALAFEDQRHGGAGEFFQPLVGVDETQAEALGDALADRGFAGAHRADEDEVGSAVHDSADASIRAFSAASWRVSGERPVTGRLIVVAGAGDVGGRLAASRAARGDEVVALRRRAQSPAPGVRAMAADLATGAGLARLPKRPDAVVFAAAPDARNEQAYRDLFVDGPRRLLDALGAAPSRFVFVSSTAVYGEEHGERVDEDTPPRPPGFNGRALLDAERALAAACAGTVVLRLSGLYGPGREHLLRRALAGEPGRPHWTNRIHVEDAAAALSHLLDLDTPASLYLGSDDAPAREDAVFAWIRERRGLPAVAPAGGEESGRRVDSRRLRASGWAPRYPDFRAGYAPLLDRPLPDRA